MDLAQLVVFVRPPVVGGTKTRLAQAIGEDGAAALYEAFVEDTLALCERLREIGRVDVALWSTDAPSERIERWAREHGARTHVQPEGDLGVRMAAAFEEGLRSYERVVLIGSDVPTLPLSLVVAAFDALEGSSLMVGPANDGGYYAIGASQGVRPRFDGVRWSTPHALSDTLRANADRSPVLIGPWYDVDDPGDLAILRAHLSANPAAAPATARQLAALFPAHK